MIGRQQIADCISACHHLPPPPPPSLNVPGGLLSFVAIRSLTGVGNKMGLVNGIFAPFGVQVGGDWWVAAVDPSCGP